MPALTEEQAEGSSVPENATYCAECGLDLTNHMGVNLLYSDGYGRLIEQIWCNHCASSRSFVCNDCGNRYNNSFCGGRNHGLRLCEHCCEDYFTCNDCGERCHSDDYGADGMCSSCAERPSRSAIRDYSSDPPRQFHGKGPHYYGVELEVEATSDVMARAEKVNALMGDFSICKSDGSLDCGFEIVTSPASLNEQRTRWSRFFDTAGSTKGLRSYRTETCGLHVHCSRKPLTDLTVAKIVCFTNANHNRRFMACIAGRPSGHWARMLAKKKLSDGAKTNENRYEAVNLQNDATIEFRIFKGTLKKQSVLKAIEFCDALIAFETPASRSLRDSLSRTAFIAFVRLQHQRWPHLAAFIEARWLGLTTKAALDCGFRPIGANQEQEEQTEE